MRRMFGVPEASFAPTSPAGKRRMNLLRRFLECFNLQDPYGDTAQLHAPIPTPKPRAGMRARARRQHTGPCISLILHSFICSWGPGGESVGAAGTPKLCVAPVGAWLLHNLVLNHHGKFYQDETKERQTQRCHIHEGVAEGCAASQGFLLPARAYGSNQAVSL